MSKQRKTVTSTYLYDPLDRLATSNSIQRFYNDTRIATEIEGERKSRFFEADSQPLALQQLGSLPGTTLLATDQQTSVLNGVSPEGALHAQAYSPFGHHPIGTSLNGAGFNGERPEPLTGHYLLGQGYRAFNPVLMRFNSPDSWSPFGEGGINAYAYCDNDPANKTDETGHLPGLAKSILRAVHLISPSATSKKTLKLIKQSADETYEIIQSGLAQGIPTIQRRPSIATSNKDQLTKRAYKLNTEIAQHPKKHKQMVYDNILLDVRYSEHVKKWSLLYNPQTFNEPLSYTQAIAVANAPPPNWDMVKAGLDLKAHDKLLSESKISLQNKKLELSYINEQLVSIRGNK